METNAKKHILTNQGFRNACYSKLNYDSQLRAGLIRFVVSAPLCNNVLQFRFN